MGASWEKIEAVMKSRGLTKADLARIARVSPGAVQKWAQGGRITLAPALLLEAELGISAGEILLRSGAYNPGAVQFLKEPGAAYVANRQPERHPLCRFPADCNLVHELAAQRAAIDQMKVQLDILTRLLGASLAAATPTAGEEKKKAKA